MSCSKVFLAEFKQVFFDSISIIDHFACIWVAVIWDQEVCQSPLVIVVSIQISLLQSIVNSTLLGIGDR